MLNVKSLTGSLASHRARLPHPYTAILPLDIQLFTSIHRYSLNEAAIHAMGLDDRPKPRHPCDEWVYVVQLKYQPKLRSVHEGKMFSLLSATPVQFDRVCISLSLALKLLATPSARRM